jgi:hypothetical protein
MKEEKMPAVWDWRLPCRSLPMAKPGEGQLSHSGGVASRTASPRRSPRAYGAGDEGQVMT